MQDLLSLTNSLVEGQVSTHFVLTGFLFRLVEMKEVNKSHVFDYCAKAAQPLRGHGQAEGWSSFVLIAYSFLNLLSHLKGLLGITGTHLLPGTAVQSCAQGRHR